MTEAEILEMSELYENEDKILDQLKSLKDVMDLYENNISSFVDESEYVKFKINPVMSEAELMKCSKYLAAGKDVDKLMTRIVELNMQPTVIYEISIPYVNAKKRYDNLKAFYQLKFSK